MYLTAVFCTALLLSAPAWVQAQEPTRVLIERVPTPEVRPEPAWLPPLSARPQMPYRQRDLCPFEYGCEFGVWQACEPLAVRAAPDFGAASIYRLAPMERFRALRADMLVDRRGRVRVEYPMFEDAARGWPPLPVGTLVDVLDVKAEGGYGIWAAGRLWGVEVFWSRNPSPRWPGRLLQAPQMTWWVHVETLGGQRGWLGLRNTVEDAMGIGFDQTLRMHDGDVSADAPDCAQLLRYRQRE